MADIGNPPLAKFFVAILYREQDAHDEALSAAGGRWGAIDFSGAEHPFDLTDYYRPEMGDNLVRRLSSFENLADPVQMIDMKIWFNELEHRTRIGGHRIVNCDVGYLDHHKIVLASAKEAGQKVYLGQGIYADLVARYQKGGFRPFEWSFPDFKDERYHQELLKIRSIYLQQRKYVS